MQHVEQTSRKRLRVEEGSLYPALRRMAQNGWIERECRMTEAGRRVKCYNLLEPGWERLEEAEREFMHLVRGVRDVLRCAKSEPK